LLRANEVSEVTESYDAAINAVDDNRPFLTEDIHTQLMAALNAARAEHIDVMVHPVRTSTPDWHKTGQENLAALEGHLNRVADLIRARLRVLAIYPD